MIKIFTVYFKGKYTPDYVTKLYHSLKRNCNVPFEFICYSDTDEVEADRIILLPTPETTDIKAHWHKLRFFDPQFYDQSPDDDIIIMDIDQVIVSDITEMICWPTKENEIVTYRKWWFKLPIEYTLNGGWYKFKSGSLKFVWDEFNSNRTKWQLHYYNEGIVQYKYNGEQNYVEDCCKRNNIQITHMPGEWICKLNNDDERNVITQMEYMRLFDKEYMVLDEPHPAIKIVHFAGAKPKDTIHDYEDGFDWIQENWR